MSKLEKITTLLLDLIYPRRCMFCNQLLNYSHNEWICKDCDDIVQSLLLEDSYELTYDSNAAFSVFQYKDHIRDAIHQLKYDNLKSYGVGLAQLVHKYLQSPKFDSLINETDILMPIPLHKSRKFSRGFNQAQIIGAELARLYEKPIECNCLIRLKNTKTQFSLNHEERRKNIKGAFKVKSPILASQKNILLIDDIYTTGSTSNECAKILKAANAKKVHILTIAKAGRDLPYAGVPPRTPPAF